MLDPANSKNINFWHDIWMEESPFIDKITQNMRTQTTEAPVSNFLENSKTWNNIS